MRPAGVELLELGLQDLPYKGNPLVRNSPPLKPYSGKILRALRWSCGGWLFLMSEVPLYAAEARSGTAPILLQPFGVKGNAPAQGEWGLPHCSTQEDGWGEAGSSSV